ncbi:MAG TPA: MFS transporter [Candidatus Bathyarchaeia archaeon]|nr:MFS transporter [Candidatus Bathyarchaeia archaeon]
MPSLPSQRSEQLFDTEGASVAQGSDGVVSANEVLYRDSATIPNGLLLAVGLLGVSVFINYIDRGNLAIAAPFLKDELLLSPKQLGVLLSSFFWTYAGFQILAGWLVDRWNVNWVLAAGFFLWSIATAATGLMHGFAALLLLRLVLGAGESVAFPSYSQILAKHCPEFLRGRANAFISSGIAAGPAVGTLVGARLMGTYGWRPFFIALGLLSLLWLLPWAKWMPTGPGLPVRTRGEAPSLLRILEERSAWGSFLGLFAYNYLSYFLLTWLPFYLVKAHGFSMAKMGNVGGAAYAILTVSALTCGWLSDAWLARGGSLTLVRKTFTALGLALASVFCIGVEVLAADLRLAVWFLFLTCAAAGLCTSNLWAITQTIAGPRAAGKWTGLQNFAGNLAGFVSPLLTGMVVDRTGHFFWAFVVLGVVLLAGALSWAFIVGRVEPIAWDQHTPRGEGAI